MNEKKGHETSDRQSTGEVSGSSGRKRQISPDTILAAVTNEQRRAILHALDHASDKTLEYDTLVDYVADRVQDGNTERVSDEHQHRIRIALRHTHLPKLEEARIINYEAETGHVQFVGGELEQEILSLVESYDTHE